ncbi:(d)CMP kinase [Vulgatibacter incomptus]|uniref:Cytidylate kinase n=1 Tax=Vulgatibacter incomptus TaxID=1391653 RepID=A0A0K1PDP5_9BACT|nr:(d)CMP kinase [Vulgatibacter incomptus]AKU91536.1 Cytidylate kinase [Vulgatibacter incomptus]
MSDEDDVPGGGRAFLVAIDGPAGAGKSTVSRLVAERLGFTLVDTGAIYRTVALAASRAGIAFDDDDGLGRLLESLPLELRQVQGGGQAVLLGGEDVSKEIRTPAISLGASAVSARPVVRSGLLELQRRLARSAEAGAVLEGRDIGTVVFPDADAKFFLTASAEARARRRYDELVAKGEKVGFDEVLADQEKRDRSDMERPIAPLRPADDAVRIDSTSMSKDEVVDTIVAEVRRRLAAGSSRD